MGLWTRLIRWRSGLPDLEDPDAHPARPTTLPPTPTTRQPPMPPPTAGTRRVGPLGETAGTPSYRSQGSTPSTRRISNPNRPGRF